MRESQERSTSRVAADAPDALMTAYADLCAVIVSSNITSGRVDDATIARLEQTTATFRARSECPRAHYRNLVDALTHATVIVERLDGMGDSFDFGPSRALLRGELRRTLATLQFIHVTAEELAHASSLLAASRQRRAALVTAEVVTPESRVTARRRANVATRVFDRVAAVTRQRPTYADALVLARA